MLYYTFNIKKNHRLFMVYFIEWVNLIKTVLVNLK